MFTNQLNTTETMYLDKCLPQSFEAPQYHNLLKTI